jgi:hypothetical protein
MADAYKVKADVSFPKPIRKVDELIDGQEVYEATGVNYAAGSYLLENDLLPRDRERAANGELDHLLEAVDRSEAEDALRVSMVETGTFIPEHEAERVIFEEYGHEVVPRDQVLELKSAGAEAAKEALEAAKEDDADQRPGLTDPEVSHFHDESGKGQVALPQESEHVPEENLVGVEQTPGVPVGPDKAAAEGEEQQSAPKRRGRPTKQQPPAESKQSEDNKA